MMQSHTTNVHAGQYLQQMTGRNVRPYVVAFMSTTQNGTQTDGWIADNPLGYYDEIEKVCTQFNAPLSIGSPIAKLRPVSDLSVILNTTAHVIIDTIGFTLIDGRKTGSPYQDAATNTAITDSLNTSNQALNQTRILNSVPPDHAPNWFRPRVLVNGFDLFGNFGTTSNFGTKNNQGDLSIGLPTPYTEQFLYKVDSLQQLDVYGLAFQYIPATNVYKRYCVQCFVKTWYTI